MERPLYPSPYIRITQKDHIGTHADSWAVDEAGSDGGIDFLVAPFTGVIKKIYTQDANEVWLESLEPVEYPDGTKDYMTAMFAHDNNVSNLKVGQVIKQGERFYEEGTKGNASGNHVHMEFAKGKFTGTGWHKDNAGYWSINNGKKISECVWINDTYKLLNTAGYNFRNVKEVEMKILGTPVTRDTTRNQLKVNAENVRARDSADGKIIGYVKPGIYNSLRFITQNGYDWHEVEQGLWFANGNWSDWLPAEKKEEPPVVENDSEKTIVELKAKITLLEKNIKSLEETMKDKNNEIEELKNIISDTDNPKIIYQSKKSDYYAIWLEKDEVLYLK